MDFLSNRSASATGRGFMALPLRDAVAHGDIVFTSIPQSSKRQTPVMALQHRLPMLHDRFRSLSGVPRNVEQPS
jgi:hypothetical protein